MKLRPSEIVRAFIFSCIILILLEMFSSTILPIFSLQGIRLSFNILLVLFLALRFNAWSLPWCILGVQWVHSIFSIEGWAIGTIAGIIISIIIDFLKDLIDLSSKISTMIVVQIFQLVWYIIVYFLLGFKLNDYSVIAKFFGDFIVQSFFLSILSPFLFIIFEKIWSSRQSSSVGMGV